MERSERDGEQIPITGEGLQRMQAELDELLNVKRPEVAGRVGAAREVAADPMESGEYSEALDELRVLEGRIATLEEMLGRAQVIEETAGHGGLVELGSEVRLRFDDGEEHTYRLVGPPEADPLEGLISNESPLGRALLGRRPQDVVEWSTPEGSSRAEILAVS